MGANRSYPPAGIGRMALTSVRSGVRACIAFLLTLFCAGVVNAEIVASDVTFTQPIQSSSVGTTFNLVNGPLSGEPIVTSTIRPIWVRSVEVSYEAEGTVQITAQHNSDACLAYEIFNNSEGEVSTFRLHYVVENAAGETDEGVITITQGAAQLREGPAFTPCDDPENQIPVARNDSGYTAIEGQTIEIPVLSNDTDEYLPGTTITIVQQPEACTSIGSPCVVVIDRPAPALDTVQFTPPVGTTGTQTFSYVVSDRFLNSAPATVSVNVNSAQGPQPQPDGSSAAPLVVGINSTSTIDVLANDQPSGQLSIVSVQSPTPGGATVEISNGQLLYTPATGFFGIDTFSYSVRFTNDPESQPVTSSVTVQVGENVPVAVNDTAQTPAGSPVTINVLSNDSPAEGVTIIAVTNPENGTVQIVNNGTAVLYSPNPNFGGGTDTFTYTIADTDPLTPDSTATVTVSVGDVPTQLANLARNPAQAAVARAIDVVCPALNEEQIRRVEQGQAGLDSNQLALLNRCNALIELAVAEQNGGAPAGGTASALEQIAGEEIIAQGQTSARFAGFQSSAVTARLTALRQGARGFSASGLALQLDGQQVPLQTLAKMVADLTKLGGGASSDEGSLRQSRWSGFITGRWNFGEKDRTLRESGFEFDNLGGTIGLDYRLSKNLVVGGALGYNESSVDFDRSGGELDAEGFSGMLYASWYAEKAYLDITAGAGKTDFDTTRTLLFADNRGGVDAAAKGSTASEQRSVTLGAGYAFSVGGWSFDPFVSLNYIKSTIDAYDESGGDGWELSFQKQEVESLLASGGLTVRYAWLLKFGVITPHLRVTFLRELKDDPQIVRARFKYDITGQSFSFASDDPDRSFFQYAVGLGITLKGGLSGFVDFEKLAGYDGFESQTLAAGLRYQRTF